MDHDAIFREAISEDFAGEQIQLKKFFDEVGKSYIPEKVIWFLDKREMKEGRISLDLGYQRVKDIDITKNNGNLLIKYKISKTKKENKRKKTERKINDIKLFHLDKKIKKMLKYNFTEETLKRMLEKEPEIVCFNGLLFLRLDGKAYRI